MTIVFMGTPDFAVPSLVTLLDHGFGVTAVVTAPDKPRGRGQQVSVTPVKQCALDRGIPVLQPDSLRDPEFAGRLRALAPDLFVVVAFRILPKEVFTIPTYGSFNLHASLLPKYRGAAPINWALINGETESGVTTFFLKETVDTGSVILQKRIAVTPEMDAGELHDALAALGASAVLETVRAVAGGTVRPLPQDDALATPAPKIFKGTCRIDWNRGVSDLRNFVRGLSPYPAAWTTLDHRTVKLFSLRPAAAPPESAVDPGALYIEEGKRLLVRASDGWLEVGELQMEGRKRMGAEEFLRGHRSGPAPRFI